MPKTYGTVTTFTAGSVLTAAQLNTAGSAINNLVVPAGARVTRTTNLSYTSNTAIAWETVSSGGGFDTDGMWSAGAATRLTINTAGIYLVTLNYYIAFSGTVTQYEAIMDSSTLGSFIAHDVRQGSFTASVIGTLSFVGSLSAADFITARVALTGGSAYVLTASTAPQRVGMSAMWIGRTS